MMKSVVTGLVLAALASGAFATPKPTKFVVSERTTAGLVRVGEIVRAADGTVTVTPIAAPKLDAITTKFVADWNAYKHPESLAVTVYIASDTGMNPSTDPHTFTFTAKDKLFKAAVIREFLAKHGYVASLGMDTIKFVEFDSSAEYPPGAHDRASKRSNFRKGGTLEYNGGERTFWIGKSIRKNRPPGEGRTSASDPTVAIAWGNDVGTIEIARMRLFEDGRIEVVPVYAKDRLVKDAGRLTAEDTKVRMYVKGAWHEQLVPKTSPRNLEAQLVDRLEHYHAYEVTPAIDPALL